MKLCIIYNFAQKYREGIYKLLDATYDCHWAFGNNHTDIKGLNYALLSNHQFIQNHYLIGPIYYQRGALALFRSHDRILMLGELFCLSTWLMLILRRTICRQKRIYLWSHGWYGKEGILKRILKRWFFSMSDTTFLYGHHALLTARSQGYSRDNLQIVHNSLDYDTQLRIRQTLRTTDIYKAHFHNEHPTIIFIGRLTKVKRLDLLITAFAQLSTPANLTIVGNGAERQNLQNLIHTLKLDNRVWLYGESYDETINAHLIYNAHLCVSPGNVGLTAVHSLTYGTPVITHNNKAWQMPEFEAIKPGVTGNFFQENDASHLAKTIEEWLVAHAHNRNEVRQHCYSEIDESWTPHYQLSVFKTHIQ